MAFSATDLACEACSREFDAMYLLSKQADGLVAKGLRVSTVARIAKAEHRMQQMLLAKWEVRRKQAVAKAASMARSGQKYAKISSEIDKIMGRWAPSVERPFKDSVAEIYKLARVAGWQKAAGHTTGSLQYSLADSRALVAKAVKKPKGALNPVFDLLDEKAISALQDDQMLWVGKHYGSEISAGLRDVTKETMRAGLGRREAGRAMASGVDRILSGKVSPPGTFRGSAAQYFEMLAANTATTARVRGQMRSFVDLGVTRVELVNPMDHRTSAICAHMNGKVVLVPNGAAQIEQEAGATSPEAIKKVHPWLTEKQIREVSPAAGHAGARDSARLARAGVVMPPFHARCRTTVDVTTEGGGSFAPLTTTEKKGLLPRPVRPKVPLPPVKGVMPPGYNPEETGWPNTYSKIDESLLRKRFSDSVSAQKKNLAARAAMDEAERRTMGNFVGPGYKRIRRAHANPSQESDALVLADVKTLEAMASKKNPNEVLLARGMHKLSADAKRDLLTKDVIETDAFTSWTADFDTATLFASRKDSVILTVKTRNGLTVGGPEAETVLGKSKFNVVKRSVFKDSETGKNVLLVELEEG